VADSRVARRDAAPADGEAEPPPKKHRSFWRELPVLVVVALVLALLIKTFLLQAFYIPSASMENTLQGGNPSNIGSSHAHPYDRVLVNKLVYDFRDPRRGEIVVFSRPKGSRWPTSESGASAPSNPIARWIRSAVSAIGVSSQGGDDFIKRVIGTAGDTVACRNDVLTVNGRTLSEPFLYPGSHPCSSDAFEGKSVTVGKGQLFVMGDHRDDSDDARVYGTVPVSDVVGRAFVVIWPVRDWKDLSVPATFGQKGLAAAGAGGAATGAVPAGLSALAVVPVAIRRRRRRRAS
jgi:signal peptidase I